MRTRVERTTDVLVLGGGFAGTRCAAHLERRIGKGRTITLVSSENYTVFQPLLPEVVGAALSPSHVISPLRHLLRHTAVVRGEVVGLELAASGKDHAGTVTVTAEGLDELVAFTAKHIVVALGSVIDTSRIPGMAEHSLLMKNVADALALRHAIIARLERAVLEPDAAERSALLTFVVVGGGFSGVETAAEINDLVRGALRYFPSLAAEKRRVVCIHSRDAILPELDPHLGKHALRVLTKRGVEFLLNTRTRAASAQGVYVADGGLIPARTIVCTVGNAPHPVLKGLMATIEGRLPTDEFLRVKAHERVWAIGDCAHASDGRGGICPPTAQFATRQGEVAAANIVAALQQKPPRPFRHKSLGQLATLGHRNAVAALGRFRVTGFLAWWLWRSVYLMKLPRLDRKLRVVIDWTLNLFFPRDLNALAVAPTHGHATIHLEAGETMFRQGDPSAAFYVVASGRIELTRVDDAGRVLGRDELGPGEHFGEGSLLHRTERQTTAVAIEPATVLSFPAQEFATLTRCFTGLRRLLEATSRRFQPASSVIPSWVPVERLQQPVRELMTANVLTMPTSATLHDCLGELLARRINAFPLVDGDGRLAGLVTSTDLFAALRRDVELNEPLTKFATTRVQCLPADAPVERAIEIMRRRDVKHVVVTDADHRVVGIVSIKDVLAMIVAAQPTTTSTAPK
jgi:NADH:ubiquinone reductase (H+-translocating)